MRENRGSGQVRGIQWLFRRQGTMNDAAWVCLLRWSFAQQINYSLHVLLRNTCNEKVLEKKEETATSQCFCLGGFVVGRTSVMIGKVYGAPGINNIL